ncbi:MAG: isochorismatase family protein [Rhizomicrobium sp.]|nr:isochorismatase family protein [Rhizomicrobium sp.]
MPVTMLDPKTALIVIDLQNGIVALAGSDAVSTVVANAARLAEAFRHRGLPVVLVNVVPSGAPRRTEQTRSLPVLPSGWDEIVPELHKQPTDHRVTKHTWGAFSGTGLDTWLSEQGVTQVVMAGVSTSIGVDTTARQAFEKGFNVVFAIDAMTDMSADAHAHCMTRIFPRIGETGTTQQIIDLLKGNA